MMLILQVCRPNERIAFETISASLKGYPKAERIFQARRSGIPRTPGNHEQLRSTLAAELDPDDVTVRRLISKDQADADQTTRILVGDITTFSPGMFIASGPPMSLWGSTVDGQPLYEGTEESYKKVVSLSVTEVIERKPKLRFFNYWFQIPLVSEIPFGNFSAWQAPISFETEDRSTDSPSLVWWDRANGRGIKVTDLSKDVPRMRFMLTLSEEYYVERVFWERIHMWLVNNYYYNMKGPTKLPEFVPANDSPIPAC